VKPENIFSNQNAGFASLPALPSCARAEARSDRRIKINILKPIAHEAYEAVTNGKKIYREAAKDAKETLNKITFSDFKPEN
jgi:hypothetical protein